MSASAFRPRAPPRRLATPDAAVPVSLADSAWLALVPCALLLAAVVVLLGPPLGRALFALSTPTDFWRTYVLEHKIRPEPTEHARYVLALLGPFALVAGAVAVAKCVHGGSPVVTLSVRASQTLLLAFVAVCLIVQHTFVYDQKYDVVTPVKRVYFTVPTLIAAAALAAGGATAVASKRALHARIVVAARETAAKRAAATAVAALFTAIWLLTAMNTDGTLGALNPAVLGNIPFWLDESMSIFVGHAPLVDFHAQYGQLWAYLGAGAMAAFGTSFGVYAGLMVAGTAATLLAVFGLLRRVSGSSLLALGLYAPFVATGFFMETGPPENRYGPSTLFSLFPIRYAGAYLLAYMAVRHIRGERPRRRLPLFICAGLVAINNLEFGLPALGATLAALAWTEAERSPRTLARLLGVAALGFGTAAALVSLLTLAVAGSLPHFGMLATFPRIYGAEGFGMVPMPALGLHLAMYVTLAATVVVASVRTIERAPDSGLTGLLVWTGVFGLGASGYFVGRSHPDVLIDVFSPWALALALLVVVAVRAALARPSRRPTLAELLVFLGFGVAACSLAQTPTPWTQVERLRSTTPKPAFVDNDIERFVRRTTRPGEPVALLMTFGHRIAYDVGVENVTPYANRESMMTMRQWDETTRALRAAHGRKLFMPAPIETLLYQEQMAALQRVGFEIVRQDPRSGTVELVDRRRAHDR